MFCITRREPQTPGTAKEPKRQEKPTISTKERQSAQLTHEAPGTIRRAAKESRRIIRTSTTALHASSTTSRRKPSRVIARSSQPTQPIAKHRQAEPHYNTSTTHTSGDTRRPRVLCITRRKQSKPSNTKESRQQSTQPRTTARSTAMTKVCNEQNAMRGHGHWSHALCVASCPVAWGAHDTVPGVCDTQAATRTGQHDGEPEEPGGFGILQICACRQSSSCHA